MSDEPAGGTKDVVVRLPRGGCIVRTSAGLVQVGAPPETIKVRHCWERVDLLA